MFKFSKAFASLGVALSMVAASTAAAHAETPTLSYADFVKSAGYLELQNANSASLKFISEQKGLNVITSMGTKLMGTSIGQVSLIVDGTKDATRSTMTITHSDNDGVFQYGYANGSYNESMDVIRKSGDFANLDEILNRLNKSSATWVNLKSQTLPSGAAALTPDELFTGKSTDALSTLGIDTSLMLFSEVTKAPSQVNPTTTIYSYTASLTDSGITANLTAKFTFLESGLLQEISVKESVDALTLEVGLAVIQIVENDIQIPTLDAMNSVNLPDIKIMSNQIAAEKSVTPKANSIAVKAQTLAKKLKKALSGKNISDAANALKVKVKAVKNGVKLTGKVSGVSGSMCVVAVKGKAVVDHC